MRNDSLAISACLKAGKTILDIYNDPAQDFGVERKSDNSPLTKADKAAHAIICEHLEKSGLPILSEEGVDTAYEQRCHWERFWLVDPLDGTKEFINKNGEFTVNIALIENSVPTRGYVYLPVQDRLYMSGADRVPKLSQKASRILLGVEHFQELPLPEAQHCDFVIVASRSHLSPETSDFIEQMKREHEVVRTISSGSSIKICQVAEGTADVYPRFAPTMEWDTAAADAIVRAAGRCCYAWHPGCDAPSAAGEELVPLCYNKPDLHNPWFLVK
ncbi:MAG: 3'(2'),5'-bisphosphate nucleotidase CysQ [Bacteroidales bacterium]|nr:3'(2'),5'-bisphosphate nucleotidase CysQ [Candidatus Physcousia equi]